MPRGTFFIKREYIKLTNQEKQRQLEVTGQGKKRTTSAETQIMEHARMHRTNKPEETELEPEPPLF